MASLLILGAGYIGAALARQALARGDEVTLADNWYATDRGQLAGLEQDGARLVTADLRDRTATDALLAAGPDRAYLLAAQASRPLAFQEPDYTEETNLLGVRRVAEALSAAGGPPLIFASSLQVYGPHLTGTVGPETPYGPQGDLAHLSKVYGELCLRLHAERDHLAVTLLRLGIVYGPGPVAHERPESQTVVDKFKGLAAAGRTLSLDDGGRATIGVVHLDDVVQIMYACTPPPGVDAANVAAETVTVADVAALAEGRPPAGEATWRCATPFRYERRLADYLGRHPAPTQVPAE